MIKSNLVKDYKLNYDCHDDDFQRLLNSTLSYLDEPTRHLHRMRINLFIETMRKLDAQYNLSSLKSAIDIGCNVGVYGKLISDFGIKNVRGIDIEASYVNSANTTFGFEEGDRKLHFDCIMAEDINDNDRYDFILCTEVIEHTQQQKEVIEKIKRILAPGGIAIITLPNAFSYPFFLTWLKYKLTGKEIHQELRDHLSYPYYKSLKLFESPELELLDTTGTNLYYWMYLDRFPFYSVLNRVNYELSKRKPFCYASQFFYMILRKKG